MRHTHHRGGVAGSYAAITAKKLNPDLNVLVMEKARSIEAEPCRGMDAINVVVIPGYNTVDEYVESVRITSMRVFDEKVTRRIAEESFTTLKQLEEWGIEFPRDAQGRYMVSVKLR